MGNNFEQDIKAWGYFEAQAQWLNSSFRLPYDVGIVLGECGVVNAFYDSSQISASPIPISTGRDEISRWGVATWSDIDPEIDYLTIQIMGLTNAYRWVDPDGAFRKGTPPATGRKYEYKTLQHNFNRPWNALYER